MFRIKCANTPAKENINTRYHSAIDTVIVLANIISSPFNCKVSRIFVRGSVVFARENIYSDLDLLVLLNETTLQTVLKYEQCLRALVMAYKWSYIVDIKVCAMHPDGGADPSINCDEKLKTQVRKHLNFDLSANAICCFGNELSRQLDVFSSCEEFRENNRLVRSASIRKLMLAIKKKPSADIFYTLIKQCIRSLCYMNHAPDSLYYATTQECYFAVKKLNLTIQHELDFLFEIFEHNILGRVPYNPDSLTPTLLSVAEYCCSDSLPRSLS